MRTWVLALAIACTGATACTGDTPSTKGRKCTGNLYDACLSEHDCNSMECRNFITEGFQVCTMTCQPGSACPKGGIDGQDATCDENGFCKPAIANNCTLP